MKIILLNVEGQTIKRSNKEQIVSNQVNNFLVQSAFSEDWDEFETIVAVFNGGDTFKAVIVENGQCFIPWETTLKESTNLLVSVVGVTEDLQFKKSPTPYLNLGTVLKGGDPNADESAEPTPSLVKQILLKFKEIEDGEAASNVYEMYNDTKTYIVGNKVVYDGSSYYCIATTTGNVPPNAAYCLLISAKGYTPVKGVDYWTETDQAEIVAAVLAALPNGDEEVY